tara:strand:+ start:7380 stop:8540 length:1161 start_codon:yes stop_codon:yes gene_type:complete
MNLISGQLRDDTVVVGGVHNPYRGAAGLVHLWIASLRSGYVPGGIRVLAAILRRTNMPRTDSPTIPSTKAGSSLQQWRVAAAFGLFPSSPKDYSARNDQWTKQMQDDPARPAAQIPLAGVIGMPIAHSRSPRLHGFWLQRYGIAGHYMPLPVRAEHLADVLRVLPRAGFVGVNVTIPHKEAVLALADAVSDRAALIGAANTLIFRPDGKIHADNTDGYGFIANLRQNAPDWRPDAGPAAVIGAGGAARAVVASLLDSGVRELRISNRTRIRSEQIKSEFGARLVVYDWAQAGNMLEGAGLVVNATSLGMTGKQPLRVPLDALSPQALATDLVYTPLETPFLAAARQIGCHTVDGLGMLLHQAAPGFERWFGHRPDVDEETRRVVLG